MIPFLDQLRDVWVAMAIRDSSWLLPAIESTHLLGLAVLLGSILVVNLRFFGLGLRRTPAARVAEQLAPVTLTALVISILSGSLLFTTDPPKYWCDKLFPYKMAILGAAILFQFTVHRKVTRTAEAKIRPGWGKLVAGLSLVLWMGVAVAGRGIGSFNDHPGCEVGPDVTAQANLSIARNVKI